MKTAPIIFPDFSLSKTAKLMIESGIRQLPVFDGKKILGFITDEKIIHRAIVHKWGNNLVKEIMTKNPQTIDGNRSVGAVLTIMREHGISHIPITTNGKLAGIISIKDVLEYVYQPKLRQTKGEIVGEKTPILNISAKGIMNKPVITVSQEETLKKAFETMQEQNISSLIVIKKEEILGIITKLDFLEPLLLEEKSEKDFEIQFAIKGIAISPYQKKLFLNEFNSFIHKYRETLISGILFTYIKTHGQKQRSLPLIHCRLQLKTKKGAFLSSAEGYGVESTFKLALDRLDRRLLRSKELASKQKYARDYLQKIGFP